MKLYIPVGIPGCGKSTLADLFPSAVHISTDAIREEITGDVNSQGSNGMVFDTFHERIEEALRNDHVFADATNLRDFARAKLRRIARNTGAEAHLLVFTNNHQAVVRNLKRERVVPEDVMDRMIIQYEQAAKDLASGEGAYYDSVIYIEGVS